MVRYSTVKAPEPMEIPHAPCADVQVALDRPQLILPGALGENSCVSKARLGQGALHTIPFVFTPFGVLRESGGIKPYKSWFGTCRIDLNGNYNLLSYKKEQRRDPHLGVGIGPLSLAVAPECTILFISRVNWSSELFFTPSFFAGLFHLPFLTCFSVWFSLGRFPPCCWQII